VLHVGVEGGAGRGLAWRSLACPLSFGRCLLVAVVGCRRIKLCFDNLFFILFKKTVSVVIFESNWGG
jgi:hypothetical protein